MAVIATEEADKEQHTQRLFAPDALRGLLMALMALDHANLFVAHKHPSAEMWAGPFPLYNDTLTFLTRLVTHLCAPGFFFLMGVGMALFAVARRRQGWSRWAITRHLLLRGALIVALKLLLVNRAWELSPGGWGVQVYIGVLLALGAGMMIGSFALWLRPIPLVALSALLYIGLHVAAPDPNSWGQARNALTYILLWPGGISGANGRTLLWSCYPVLPWLGLVTFGIAFGYWLADDARRAYGWAASIGAAFLAGFLLLRYLNGFGNLRPRMGNGWIDWLNVVKYPPSLSFVLLTMGVNLLALAALSRARGRWHASLKSLVVFGQAPWFFYTLHLFLYAALGRLLTPKGTSIPGMWPVWLLGLAILWPLCRWYGQWKHKQPATSLARML